MPPHLELGDGMLHILGSVLAEGDEAHVACRSRGCRARGAGQPGRHPFPASNQSTVQPRCIATPNSLHTSTHPPHTTSCQLPHHTRGRQCGRGSQTLDSARPAPGAAGTGGTRRGQRGPRGRGRGHRPPQGSPVASRWGARRGLSEEWGMVWWCMRGEIGDTAPHHTAPHTAAQRTCCCGCLATLTRTELPSFPRRRCTTRSVSSPSVLVPSTPSSCTTARTAGRAEDTRVLLESS